MAVNRIAYLLAGAALGAVGMALVKDGKGAHLLQGLVHGGHGLTEKLMGTVETIREDVEDYLAEARYMHDEKVRQQAEEAAGKPKASAAASKPKTAAKKKAAPRKTAAKSTKKSAAKESASAKTTTKKAPAKKAAAKKPAASKTTAKAKAGSKKTDA